ncbi:hypothetical protein [Photobacterium damselae]|uniref:hypothetical protein n=1 Tax=Photobacterium damselae TaxID=38293 RepID=UPI001F1D81AD|nr:hypothetical protein [Photobacterium damselae]UKA04924.1 hypothetical protein IHC89_22020 [Photobacterium damselae subsp. damselae]
MKKEKYQENIELAKKLLGESFVESEIKDFGGDPLSPLDVFCWCDEVYIVYRSGGFSGVVLDIGGDLASSRWYWDYQGEHNVKIGTITQEKMDSFIKS